MEGFQLRVSALFLNSSILHLKIEGLKLIEKIIEEIKEGKVHSIGPLRILRFPSNCQKEWIEENFFEFMLKQGFITEANLEEIWHGTKLGNMEISLALYKMFSHVAKILSTSQIEFLSNKVYEKSTSDLHQDDLMLLQELMPKCLKDPDAIKIRSANLNFFWKIIATEQSDFSQKLIIDAKQRFCGILQDEPEKIKHYINLCVENVQKGNAVF